ncbi:putative Capsular polysaccharide synthesis protein [Monocercomonoides exilis]|uniref:putative Capsular polysaccharide synthesis protein n=1 Tax=Monocercomonoides exilis TaxID=2049356 RepID=UPI00355952D8|nr:putative Capsular polysaccharide synthesis protein [Monocercomonoides exilis]|eukprot:MONOS_10017.1-p1 / transcript=MONOS_10017.1 / gene=MONOS_10017 / organism=Monocercomonoides_exilis_PA203 / gene_product=unspecified product / transcript_product=unspecified product / location=Mono_scaffold00437:31177-32064(+) / protein_length=295 / sequence_SO=supercontig / SO=protein_coding / is_pseudo=false
MNRHLFMTLLLSMIVILFGASFLKANTTIKEEKTYEVPRIIWLYWEGELNQEVRYLLHNMKEKIANFTLIFITDSTINLYLDRDSIPSKLRKLPLANKADFYRLRLIHEYGGLWMDVSMYLKNDTFLEDCYRDLTEAKADLLAFNSYWPPAYHIELGYLMAPKGSPLIGKVLEEFRIMLSMGVVPYMKDRIYNGIIMKSPCIHEAATKTKREYFGTYFAPYVCMQTVVQREYYGNPNAILRNSVDYWFKLHESCYWNSTCVADRWDNDPEVHEYPILKFYAGTRGKVKFPDVDII